MRGQGINYDTGISPGDRGGMGWAIIDDSADPPRLDGDHTRDEAEQVRYLEDLHTIFEEKA
jgi:hypothetical protein